MNNKNDYNYLLSDLTKLKGVGSKTASLLKRKKLTQYLIYFGNFQNPTQIEVFHQILKI